jgi:putative endonuclease
MPIRRIPLDEYRAAAADFLPTRGMRELDRAWQSTEGWLDLVAEDRGVLVVIDIHTRSESSRHRRSGMGSVKRTKLRRLAVAWMRVHGKSFAEIRVDTVTLITDTTNGYAIEYSRGTES